MTDRGERPAGMRGVFETSGGVFLAAAWGVDALRFLESPGIVGWQRDNTLALMTRCLEDCELWRLDPAARRVRLDLRHERGPISIAPDAASYFAPASNDYETYLCRWDVATQALLSKGLPLDDELAPLAVSPDGSHVVFAPVEAGSALTLAAFARGAPRPIEGWRHDDSGLLVFSEDGASLLLASPTRLAHVDVATARIRASIDWDGALPPRAEWQGAAVDVVSSSRGLLRWWVDDGRLETLITAPPGARVTDARRRGDRAVLVADGVARWFDRDRLVCERRLEGGAVTTISPDLRFVVDLTPPAAVWYTEDIAGPQGGDDSPLMRVDAIALTSDGSVVAAGGGGDVAVWDVASGALVARFECAEGVDDLRFHPSGATLFACDGRGAVFAWDVASGRERAHHAPPTDGSRGPWRVALSPDGDQIIRWGPAAVPDEGREIATVCAVALAFEAGGARVTVEHVPRGGRRVERVVRARDAGGVEVLSERAFTYVLYAFPTHLSDDATLLLRQPLSADENSFVVGIEVTSTTGAIVLRLDRGTPRYARVGARWLTHEGNGVMRTALAAPDRRASGRLALPEWIHGAALAASRDDRTLAVGLPTGTVLLLADATFDDALASVPPGRDLRPWVATLASKPRAEALAHSRSLRVGYLEGLLTAARWAERTGAPLATPWEIDAAVAVLWDALVEVGLAEPSVRWHVSHRPGLVRRWAWQPRWNPYGGPLDPHVRQEGCAFETMLDEAFDVLGDPNCPRRDALVEALSHPLRDACNDVLPYAESFAAACASAGACAARIRAIAPDADVSYLERLAGYARPRVTSREDARRMARDVAACHDPGDDRVRVEAAGGGWTARFPDGRGAMSLSVDAATGAVTSARRYGNI